MTRLHFLLPRLYSLRFPINVPPRLAALLCLLGSRGVAVDKVAGHMHRNGIPGADKICYTTGRLTSEMVINTMRIGNPILLSRSSFTGWGVEPARNAGLTLIGRTGGKRFVALSCSERIVFDQSLDFVAEDAVRRQRKAAGDDV